MNEWLTVLLEAKSPNFLFYNDKMNAVVAVLAIIWLGIVLYLIFTERKINRLEKEIYSGQQQSEKEES